MQQLHIGFFLTLPALVCPLPRWVVWRWQIFIFIGNTLCKNMMFYVSAFKLYEWNELSQSTQLSDLCPADVLPLCLQGTCTAVQRGLQLQPLGGRPSNALATGYFTGMMRDPVLVASCPRIRDIFSNFGCCRANKCP